MAKRSIVIVLLALLALGACDSVAPLRHPEAYDYRQNHPLVVEPSLVVLDLASATGAVAAGDEDRLAAFAGEYLRRGKGPLEIWVGAASDADARAKGYGQAIAASLLKAGLRPAELGPRLVMDDPAIPPETALLRFRSNAVRLPECYDWSDGPRNAPSANFGCAVQRNIGLMVADPNDLVERRDLAPAQGTRPADTVDKYQKNQATWGPVLPWSATSSSASGGK